MAQTFSLNGDQVFETVECCVCAVVFAMPQLLKRYYQNNPSEYFHCPNGHSQHFQKSRDQRLREEAETKLKTVDAQRIRAENELAALKRKRRTK